MADTQSMRASILVSAALAALGAAGGSAAAQPAGPPTAGPVVAIAVSWAAAPIGAVTTSAALGNDPATFRVSAPLSRGELAEALAAWGKPSPVPADPARLVTVRELDARLVAALGLRSAARRIRVAARDAGLAPTATLGTETVARLLGLRLNHPRSSDDLELLPSQPASRAEAAYSLARALMLTPEQIAGIDRVSLTFAVPDLSDWQRAVLGRALRFVGYPYVWAGTSEVTQELWSATAPGGTVTASGGFDCSGFVWRVYKTKPFAGAPLLGDILEGRTTSAMSAEVRVSARIGVGDVLPGDVIFFGSRGARSSPAQIGHMGVYVGNGWFVHSSEAGVTLRKLEGWYSATFAWARRPLAEAGLVA